MARTSPVHYIAPSAISITPNCNSSANDLAVYLARDAKIRVFSKEAGIDYVNADFQQWTLKGRNRRLADSAKPYTIYARLHKTDHTDGYLIFAAKNLIGGVWYDKYAYVTLGGIVTPEGATVSDTYYYIRIGDVSLPENGQRTLTYDTGILGTDQYNTDWIIDPDLLKRIMLQCSIDGRDAGSTPYVPWEKDLVLTAQMASGWFDPEILTFDHWTLVRDTGDADADAAWLQKQAVQDFAQSGTITMSHPREGDDDFNGTVSSVFKVTAYGKTADGTVKTLAATSISIMAETVETYTIALSTVIVSYNPQTKTYNPDGGVMVRVRAKDQRGNLIRITNEQFEVFGLKLQYKRASAQAFTDLPLDGGDPDEVAVATVPIDVFATQESVDLRLVNTELKELDVSNIAFVRDGEDSKEREWIFLRSSEAITFGDITSPHPLPSLIPGGEVSPHGTAGGADHNKQQDDWVPEGWTDDSLGTDEDTPYEYGSYRDYIHGEDDDDGRWGDFVAPRVWSHFGEDAITYDIIPSASVITADSSGVITMDGIAVKAYRIKGLDRSENILPEGNPPSSGDYYFAEYSVDGGGYVPCVGLTQMDGYGIDADALATARESVAFRLKHSSAPDVVLKDSLPINVIRAMSEDWVKNNFLSKVVDDVAQGVITFVKGFWVKAKNLFGIDENGDAWLHNADMNGSVNIGENLNVNGKIEGTSAILNEVKSTEYTGDGMLDAGYRLWYEQGRAKLVIDDLVARGKFTVNELEARIWTYAGGNMVFSGAGSTIFFVEYLNAAGTALGYTYINSPWLLGGRALLSSLVAWSKRRKIQRQLTPEEQAQVVKFRCYEYSDDGTIQTRNWWHVNDLAMCQTLNKVKGKVNADGSYSGSASNTVYRRRVAGIGSKMIDALDDGRVYDYVDLWNIYDVYGQTYINAQGQTVTITDSVKGFLNMAPSGQTPSADWPAAGDVIVQMGNPLDADRQGAVTIEVQGDVHGIKVYDTINDYSMANNEWVEIGYDQTTGKAKANVYGDFRFGHRLGEQGSYISYNRSTGMLEVNATINVGSPIGNTGQTFQQFFSTLAQTLTGLQNQLDQKAETWYQSTDPSAAWITPEQQAEHVGDLWYCIADISGTSYAKDTTWYYKDNGESASPRYTWVKQDIPQSVFDTIDGKANVYVTWGAWGNNLHVRDLFIPNADTEQGGVIYKMDKVYRCTAVTPSITFKEIEYTDDTALVDFAAVVTGELQNLQSQIDGQIEAWFYNYSPVHVNSEGVPDSNVPLNVAPYSDWATDALKIAHLGDTFTNNSTGYCWRFSRNATTNAFEWVVIEDSAAIKALENAARAQDTADNKRRVFICDATHQTPTPPYDEGDLWVNVKYPWSTGETYNNEILKCDKPVPREEGGQKINTFSIGDWSLSNGYTSKLNNFVTNTYAPFVTNIQSQVDQKAETWRQTTDPANSWTNTEKAKHVGDIWMDISDDGGKKTYIYVDNGAGANPRYAWEEQEVPDDVFDEIDGKAAIYVAWNSDWDTSTEGLNVGDMLIPSADITKGSTTYKAQKVYKWNGSSWQEINYTDDTALTTFINGTYANNLRDLHTQIDQKAETWYQSTDPSAAWTTSELKNEHKGDIWHNTNSQTVSGVGSNLDAIWDGTSWVVSDVPKSVYDKIDGKADIFVSKPVTYNTNDMWIIESGLSDNDMPAGCKAGDIVISSSSRTNAYTKGDWAKKDRYTDDATVNNFVNVVYAADKQNIQDQIDGKYETFFYDGVPTLSNLPASQWTTDAQKNEHVNDLYWDKTAKHAYRFVKSTSGTSTTYRWEQVGDSSVIAAMAEAAAAQDTADNKRRVFVSTPTTPYDVGDLWSQGPSGELMRCKTAKASGDYDADDWEKASKYTDDSALDEFKQNQYVLALTGGTYDEDIETALTRAGNAETAAGNAATSASNAATSASNAASSASSASSSASSASSSASSAASSASSASSSASSAASSASSASSSASSAASSAQSAANEATAAKNKANDIDDATKVVRSALLGKASLDGGLIMTTLIGLRQYNGSGDKNDPGNYTTYGGLNGVYNNDSTPAAWFGGPMVDRRYSDGTYDKTSSNKANAMIRMGGSGYFARGNFHWDNAGNIYLDGEIHSASGTIGGFDIGSDHLGESLSSTAAGTTYMTKNGHISLRNPSNAAGGNVNGAIYCTGGVLLQGDSTRKAQLSNSDGETLIYGSPLNLNTQNSGTTYIGSTQSALISNSSKNTFKNTTEIEGKFILSGNTTFITNNSSTAKTVALPSNPSRGQVVFAKGTAGNLTLTGAIRNDEGSVVSSVGGDKRSRIFIYGDSYWNEFYCS